MTRKRNPSRRGTICPLFPDKDFLAFSLSSARLENHWSEKWSVAVLERKRQKSDLLNSLDTQKVSYFGRQGHTSVQSVQTVSQTHFSLFRLQKLEEEVQRLRSEAEEAKEKHGEVRKKFEYIFAGTIRFPRNRFGRTKGRRKKELLFIPTAQGLPIKTLPLKREDYT